MSVRVKLCGMSTADDVAMCAGAGADALGFIFAQSPRRLSIDAACALTLAAPPFVTTVGVFANDDAALVRAAIDRCRLDVLQFSGDDPPAFCGSFGKPTILSLRGRRFDGDALRAARAVALLVDAWSASEFGGTGRVSGSTAFQQARAQHEGVSLILAGGLTPVNVGPLVAKAQPDAVDARTGVERDGRKDPALVRAFVNAARGARHA